MATLSTALRSTLEKSVVEARKVAEAGASEALKGLAVDAAEPFSSMTEAQRKLRNRLRAHGRQLGDALDRSKGTQGIGRLVREVAYAHWHRMLFARFLADNHLLIEPTSGVSISMEECEELAKDEGVDPWGLAARYAQGMLPEIFRTDDPVLELAFAPEIRQKLQKLVSDLQPDVFTASDGLGWTYQFWQTAAKEAVNDSGVKIGAEELPAVTQLFTEDYMVDFLLDSTLGAWHAGKVLAANAQLARTAQSEEELRHAVALPGCHWSYLRFIQGSDGPWTPAAGTFDGWPKTSAELRCLDPCMGSGHFVVAMFERLVALRIAEEGLDEAAAVAAVIEGNLFGLEIDPRCTQIAAFNLALAAWRRVGHCQLPPMNLACSGLAPNTTQADWLALAGESERLRNGMERLYGLFDKAAVLGSLINPRSGSSELLVASFHELQPLLELALVKEAKDDNAQELAVTARGLAKAAEILAGQFTLVATNVPYLGRGKQSEVLQEYCYDSHFEAKNDLATCFIDRCLGLASTQGYVALVTPQSWLTQDKYDKCRKIYLQSKTWLIAAQLGPGAFGAIKGEVVKPLLFVATKGIPPAGHQFLGLDVISKRTPVEKAAEIASSEPIWVAQIEQLSNPKSRVSFGLGGDQTRLLDYCRYSNGIQTGDSPRFSRCFWEVTPVGNGWAMKQTTVDQTTSYGGMTEILWWEDGEGDLAAFVREKLESDNTGAWLRGKGVWGLRGVLISAMGRLNASLYLGDLFDDNTVAIVPQDQGRIAAVWAACSDDSYHDEVRKIDKKLNVRGPLVEIPFDLDFWENLATEKYSNGLPKPFSSDPTQWLFSGQPNCSDKPLQVAVARLLGYQWPRQTGSSFPDCPALGPDGLEPLADDDGIVCLSPARGEAAAADRLRGLLAAAFGDEWSNAKERELLCETAVANDAKKAAADLGEWLRQNFFAEHCKLFHSRPFIW